MTPEEKKAYAAAYYKANKEKHQAQAKRWEETHPEERRASNKKYRTANIEKCRAATTAWKKRNPGKCAANWANYHARKLEAMPSWLTPGMKEAISYKYETAQKLTESTGIPHHVDHIIPLQGKGVRGLHVPWNLQVITAEENWSKGNTH